MVETPIWKTSYRLMMDDKSARPGLNDVENKTKAVRGADVVASLIEDNRPISSFIMDLYQPLYLQRPTVVRPVFYAGSELVRTTPERTRRSTGADESCTTLTGGRAARGGVNRRRGI